MSLYHSKRRTYLAALVQELKDRGLEIPPELLEGTKMHLTWPMDENGFFKKVNGSTYNPYDQQRLFVLSRAVFSLFRGARGAGKTTSGAQKALAKIKKGENGAVLNPDFENLKISTWPEFREWIPWDLVVPKHQYRKSESWQPLQPFTLVFKNGVRVTVKGVKDPDSARGPNINWLWYDEGGRDRDGMSWKIAIASVRVGTDPQAWITTTPNYEAPWIEEFFVEKKIPADALEIFEKLALDRELVESFHGSIYDNEKNLNPVFMASMLATYPSGWLRKQEILGESVTPDSSLGDRSWFDGMYLSVLPEKVKKRIRFWDLAGTEKKMIKGKEINDPDETVGTKMSLFEDGKFCIENQVGAFVEWDGVLRLIRDTSIKDGYDVKIFVEQEPASGGKNQVAAIDDYLKQQIPGHPGCEGWKPSQDRVILANIWFAEANQKKIYILKDGSWDLEGCLGQLDLFPGAKHDDKITSITGARLNIAPIQQWKNIPFLALSSIQVSGSSTSIVENKSPDGKGILLL